MRTLDEVIKAIEVCQDSYVAGKIIKADALHYLREYHTLQYSYIKAMADLEDNPPLTWDELKTMKGKPVWVEWDDSEEAMRTKEFVFSRQWEIISEVYEENIVCIYSDRRAENHFAYSKDNLGKTWQAYRKERK